MKRKNLKKNTIIGHTKGKYSLNKDYNDDALQKKTGFTFVVVTYNHEEFIDEHLESIKNIVDKFGKNYKTELIISDDNSRDATIKKCEEWLNKNTDLFDNYNISINDENIGTVNNVIKAINLVETNDFKLLAGDDKYKLFDIYSLYKNLNDKILITHVESFGEYDEFLRMEVDIRFEVLNKMFKRNRLDSFVQIDNYIAAPGVFIPCHYLRDKFFQDFLSDFFLIEDYPMWIYLIVIKNIDIIVEDVCYIAYRICSGVSTSDNNEARRKYVEERNYIYKRFKIKNYILPKYINPYRYWLFFLRNKVRKQLYK